jgi:hypothetical protein
MYWLSRRDYGMAENMPKPAAGVNRLMIKQLQK